jgi:hypothetical protein
MLRWFVWRLNEVKELGYAVQSFAHSLNAAQVVRTTEEDPVRKQ